MTTNYLKIRNEMKSKKPEFERSDSNIMKQFKGTWRRPKGMHNKMRRGYRGHSTMPSIGYSSPKKVKGLTRKGLKLLVITNIKDLEKIKEDNAAIIASNIGMKKRIEILKKAKENKIIISNIKDIDSYLNKLTEKLSKNKKTEKQKETKEEKKDEPKK